MGYYPKVTDGVTPWTMKHVLVTGRGWPEKNFEFLKMGLSPRLSSRLRSLRRALAGLVDDGHIIAVGKPSDPHRRYIVHPHCFRADDPRRERVMQVLYKMNNDKLGGFEALKYQILDDQLGFTKRMFARMEQAVAELERNKA